MDLHTFPRNVVLLILLLAACASAQVPLQGMPGLPSLPPIKDPSGPQVQPIPEVASDLILFPLHINKETRTVFITQLVAARKAGLKEVTILIHSGGGEFLWGYQMAEAIEMMPFKITCVVDSSAFSMALYVFQSCPIRKMTERSKLLAHTIKISVVKDARVEDLQDLIEEISRDNAVYRDHVIFKTKMKKEDYDAQVALGHDFIIPSSLALSLGFVDEIVPNPS